jgi:hypothetical protein
MHTPEAALLIRVANLPTGKCEKTGTLLTAGKTVKILR